ncbi:MAG: hypothetical protein JW940_02915 [Polyangiaceae bacterium]|nr:hypothetical protein [Polyangiaceae bacterium]
MREPQSIAIWQGVSLTDVLLALMLSLPAPYGQKEDSQEREARLATVAQAIDRASRKATCSDQVVEESCVPIWRGSRFDLAMLLVTEAYWESRLAKNVHEGKCRAYECDPYQSRHGVLLHRARTLWQLQRSGPIAEDWDRMVGVDAESTTAAAWAATKLFSRAHQRCGSIAGAISLLAGGAKCTWSQTASRMRLFQSLARRARAMLRQQ